MKTVNQQLKIILVLLFPIFLVFSACKKDDPEPPPPPPPTTLNITITQHPEGGNKVNKLSCEYQGIISGTVSPVSVTVQWWWEDGNHDNAKMMESEETIFNSGNATTKTTLYKTQVGYVLLNYYWVKLIWTDDNGQHEMKSSKAYCTNN